MVETVEETVPGQSEVSVEVGWFGVAGVAEKVKVKVSEYPLNPQLVLDFYNQRRRDVLNAQPNSGHKAITQLENKFDVTVVTQNIDDLHERAGSTNIIHLHGEILKSRSSLDAKLIYEYENDIKLGEKCAKGSQIRPHIVWFNEAVPMIEVAAREVSSADILIIAGTSLQVYPAAGLINYAHPTVPKFLVDPNIPDVSFVRNITCIAKKGSEGLPKLVESLLKQEWKND